MPYGYQWLCCNNGGEGILLRREMKMSTNGIRVGRSYSHWRISAYECDVNPSGDPMKRRGYVAGWYGMFTLNKLQSEIMPKLAEHAAQGRHYPFLITSHQLEDKTTVHVTKAATRRVPDVDFSPRRRCSQQTWTAVVLSPTKFRVLINS